MLLLHRKLIYSIYYCHWFQDKAIFVYIGFSKLCFKLVSFEMPSKEMVRSSYFEFSNKTKRSIGTRSFKNPSQFRDQIKALISKQISIQNVSINNLTSHRIYKITHPDVAYNFWLPEHKFTGNKCTYNDYIYLT